MPFKQVNPAEEQREFEELLKDPEAKKAYEEFEREYTFRQRLAEVRKIQNITQQDIHNKTGLPQQSISRIEKGTTQKQSPTLRTLLKYIDAIDCELTITPKKYF
ncbi:MAG: helix-turn-helix domain-containing protein [Oscillospiraceae bacterium]|nr:helix-turn-helix domain-containing protein [Oscillospiraceae bacterium]